MPDSTLLAFAASKSLLVVTHDLRTMPKYAYERVKAGLPMAGVIAVPNDLPVGRVIEDVVVLVECATSSETRSRVVYLPL